jgi:hypothetical protein
MKFRQHVLLSLAALLAGACLSNPDGCPRAGLDSARRCKRLCVAGLHGDNALPLPCTCLAECLCWEMSGHPRRPEPPAPARD